MADVVLFGAGQIAAVAKAYIDAHGPDRVVGFTVDEAFCQESAFCDLPLVAWERLEQRFPPDRVKLLGPLSFRNMNELRRDRHAEGKARGYSFASFVHPAALVYASSIGENAFILEANVIQPFVEVGQGAMFWTANHIGHHSVIGDYCFIASHATIGSNVRIGDRTWVGGDVGIVPGVSVGAGVLIGAKAMVSADVPAESVVHGQPGGRVVHMGSERLKRLV